VAFYFINVTLFGRTVFQNLKYARTDRLLFHKGILVDAFIFQKLHAYSFMFMLKCGSNDSVIG